MFTRCATVLALVAMATLASGGDVAAQGQGRGGGRGGPPMTPLLYRQHIMQHFQESMQALGAIRGGTAGAAGHLMARAVIVQQLASMLPEAFPAGSGGEGSRALPAIWESAADFTARVQAAQTAASSLVDAVRGGNADAIQAAQQGMQQACQGCHMAFRGPPPGA
jgi:cytochrome c556